ncbi:MAG: alpha/beta fold hydrolase [Chloroflexi bacterium]|nr:alpha/beta fold hydrolase [Chloroflexota bacterium]
MHQQSVQNLLKPFIPHRWVRSGQTQTLLSSYRPRQFRSTAAQPILLDAGPDMTGYATDYPVRLLGYYSPTMAHRPARGLVLTLHGWEGDSHSFYNLLVTQALNEAGFDVFRLNLRDHGPNLHVNPYALNPGLFLGTLVEETATAVQRVAEMARERPFYIVGTSMGGSFALRLALRQHEQPINNLQKVIAFNPAINPAAAVQAIDKHHLFRRHFRKRWLGSLLAKQHFYPQFYSFAPLLKMPLIFEMTEWLISQYNAYPGHFHNATEYFEAYAITGQAFQTLTVPTTIITAVDDPIVPVADFLTLTPHPLLDLQIHPTGGHVGFVDIFPLQYKLPRLLLDELI